jgi:hypothetical protein
VSVAEGSSSASFLAAVALGGACQHGASRAMSAPRPACTRAETRLAGLHGALSKAAGTHGLNRSSAPQHRERPAPHGPSSRPRECGCVRVPSQSATRCIRDRGQLRRLVRCFSHGRRLVPAILFTRGSRRGHGKRAESKKKKQQLDPETHRSRRRARCSKLSGYRFRV